MFSSVSNKMFASHWWKDSLYLFYIVSLTFISYILIYKIRTRNVSKMLKQFYTVHPILPIIGNVHLITGDMKERVVKLLTLMKSVQFPVVGWLFHIPVIVVGTAEDAQIVLSKTYVRSTLGVFKNVIQDGIILANGAKWRKSRRLMNPAFSSIMLQQYLRTFNEQSEILIEKIASFANTDKTIDLWNFLPSVNLDISTKNMAGYDLHLQKMGQNKFSNAILKILKLESLRFTTPWLFPNFMYNAYLWLTGNGILIEEFNELPRQIVKAKIEEYKLNKRERQDEENIEGRTPKTLVDLLLEIHDTDAEFTEDSIRIEILNMILAGSESTSLTGSFLILMLAMHTDVQEKVYQELQSVLGDKRRPLQMEDMNKLVYLERCIKETLRKFPVLPLTFRKHPENLKLNGEKTIPANCQIVVAFHAVHHDPNLYSAPDTWNPDHFAPQVIQNHGKYAFLAFGAGPRACIGAKYAILSLKTQIAHLLRNYRFTTNQKLEDVTLILDAALRSENGYLVQLWSRENNNEGFP